ncbi:MAG: homing endonuclease associated repeat-containing protein [Limisphaerales bacterium]
MAKLELQTLTNYDNQTLIAEIKRVSNLLPDGKLNRSEFDRLSKVHSSTLRYKFGSWRKALEAADLGKRFNDSNEALSREKIIEQLKMVSNKLGHTTVIYKNFRQETGISINPILRIFGSFRNALKAAGLTPSSLGVRYTDEECYENLLDVWTALGRQPVYSEMKNLPSRVGPKAYVLRWGGWRKALAAFIERVNQDVSEEPAIKSKPVIKSLVVPPVKRTSRDIRIGLRYKVLMRDGCKCVLCGRSQQAHNVDIHFDHIKPWSKGGETVFENLRVLCSDCNLGKGASIE